MKACNKHYWSRENFHCALANYLPWLPWLQWCSSDHPMHMRAHMLWWSSPVYWCMWMGHLYLITFIGAIYTHQSTQSSRIGLCSPGIMVMWPKAALQGYVPSPVLSCDQKMWVMHAHVWHKLLHKQIPYGDSTRVVCMHGRYYNSPFAFVISCLKCIMCSHVV